MEKPAKLSDAIEAGCKVTQYLAGGYIDYIEGQVRTCAIGAALVGVAGVERAFEQDACAALSDVLVEVYPELARYNPEFEDRARLKLPEGGHTLMGLIISISDEGEGGRERAVKILRECGL